VKQLTPIGVSEVIEWNHKQRFDIGFRLLVLSIKFLYVFKNSANLGVKSLKSCGLLISCSPHLGHTSDAFEFWHVSFLPRVDVDSYHDWHALQDSMGIVPQPQPAVTSHLLAQKP
jgi:hypothetical protein